MTYLLLPRLRVRAANAMAGNYAVQAAPVMAVSLFTHNLGLKTGCHPLRVAILHHDAQLLGEYGSDGFYDFHPQQRRGASFIDDVDYSSKNRHALSLQPTASCHLTLSLLIEVDGRIKLDRVLDFLRSARIAGGCVDGFGKPESANELDGLQLPKGFWLIERSDLLDTGANPVDALVGLLGRKSRKTDTPRKAARAEAADTLQALPESWFAATVLGYAATTPFARRAGVRQTGAGGQPETPLHAFCEPLLGVVQYVSTGDFGPRPVPFWEHTWLQDDVFVVRQSAPVQLSSAPPSL
ncbi:type I-F CRISPR-associated protein Csy2 [Thauera butanivorans]|uniref:type I-F CRISPR-associated protein Csy2 n=1 Tax=Thauera butanivorans TaxID=86174 RepID=UPI003AB69F52